ncbi:hypothetical protein ACO0LB_19820 [Undibacterium sp. SXout7W]|uniref:hypothetical protein n=1 Tax=Undibacterium sp. SXout7W TaxID=3413049 RepID=UPI003BF38A38
MKKIIQLAFPDRAFTALLGLYFAAACTSFILLYWVSIWSDILDITETELQYKGLALIIGTTLIRHILIAHGKDIAANWLNSK